MSKSVIKYGKIPTFVITCTYCNTIFSYHRSDVYRRRKLSKKTVMCPYCDKYLRPTYVEYSGEATE